MKTTRPLNPQIIKANSRSNEGLFTPVKNLFRELKIYRGQIKAVYSQKFRDSYYGTVFGVFWNFILPLIPLTVYLLLAVLRIFPTFGEVDRLTYIVFGVMIWFVFVGFINIPISSVKSGNDVAMKTSLPLSVGMFSNFSTLIFETVVRIFFVLGVMIVMSSYPVVTAPAVILIFISSFFLFFGSGLILAVLNIINKDIERVVRIILQYGVFVSGVIFPLGTGPFFDWFNRLNPFSVYVDASRKIVFEGQIHDFWPLVIWTVVGLIVFILGCRIFYIMEYRIRGIQ